MKKFNPLLVLIQAAVIISLLGPVHSIGLPPDETFYETVIVFFLSF